MVTFLIAGHETTSGLLSFALYLLLKHPDVLQKARAQVDEVLGAEMPRVEDLHRITYLEQVMKEALRLWPTAPAFAATICGPAALRSSSASFRPISVPSASARAAARCSAAS